jgi:hypothetical protein
MNHDDERPSVDPPSAWPAQEPPPGFADRVLEASRRPHSGTTSAAIDRDAGRSDLRRSRGRHIAAGVVFAAAMAAGVAFSVHLRRTHQRGDVVAEARRELRVGTRAVAVLERGAHVAWTEDSVEQASGDVFWRVDPGARFAVRTPGGEVAVRGTCFRVRVLAAGTAAAAAVVVGVYEGRVAVTRGAATLELSAGEAARADSNGVRRTGEVADEIPSAAPVARDVREQAPAADRRTRDRMRELIWRAFGQAAPASGGASGDRPYALPSAVPDPPGVAGHLDAHDIQDRVRADFFPMASGCYVDAEKRTPGLRGRILLHFAIVGDSKVGGVVESADVLDASTIRDPMMIDCLRESMLSLTFPPPKQGGFVTVEYPIEFSPDEPDGGSD